MAASDGHPKKTSTESLAIPQIQIMSPPRSPTTATRRQSRDTGFPEPFHGGSNTTLPHPEADLSPNACITHDEGAYDRALKRHRISFRHRNKHTISHGVISPQLEALHSVLSLVDTGASPRNSLSETPKRVSPSISSQRLSKEDSFQSQRDDDTPPTSPDASEHSPRKGRFRKWLK